MDSAATAAAATTIPKRDVMRSSMLRAGALAPPGSPCLRIAPALYRGSVSLILKVVVDLDGLPAQKSGRVPAVLERLDHRAIP